MTHQTITHFVNNLQQLRCVLLNAQSLGNKLQELHYLLYCECAAVVLITESWCDDTFTHGILDPEFKFNIYRRDRNRHGGGVCLFVTRLLHSAQVHIVTEFNHLEIVCVDVLTIPTTLRVFVAYRPPSSGADYQTSLMQCISTYCSLNCVNIVTGDFNCPRVDWSHLTCPDDMIHEPLLKFAIECGFIQTVKFPTREENILDLVLIDDVQRLLSICERPPLGHSDHSCVEFSVLLDFVSDIQSVSSSCYLWNSADFNSINHHLASIDWLSFICDNPDASGMWSAFIDVIFYIVSLYVPYRTTQSCKHSPKCYNHVYPKDIRKAFAGKLRCWRRYKANPSSALKLKYQRCTQTCKQLITEHVKNCETRVLDVDNIGAFYKFANKRLGNKTGISPLYDESGKLILDDCGKANLLNNYFSSVGTVDNGVLPSVDTSSPSTRKLQLIVFTETNVTAAIRKLKSNLSSGPDGLPPLLYKRTCCSLARPLALLFTQLLSVSVVPDTWKTAIVTPVFKKGLSTDVANYRPISLTCVASKIMERIIVDQMTSFLADTNVINRAQHGFVKGLSTTTNLLESFNDWTISIQARKSVTVAYIDFAKAFDSVSHPKLLYRLRQYGIDGCLLDWIRHFLAERTQVTRVGSQLSSMVTLCSGTVQGSGIGPLLFLTYINELASILAEFNVTVKLFADDVKLYAEVITDVDAVHFSHALSCISEWANMWQLQVSTPKCCMLQLNPRYAYSSTAHFTINGASLSAHDSVRDLGVIVNESLTPSTHIAKITATAHQRVNLIFRAFVSRDIVILLRAYTTYVRPILEFNTVVWSPSLKCDITSVEKVQRKFTKRLPGYGDLSYAERRAKLNLQTLELRRLHYDLVMCYKIVFNIVKLQFSDFFVFSRLPTRGHPYKLQVNHAPVNVRRNFFACRVVRLWNSLPTDTTDFGSLSRFRNSLHRIDFSSFLIVD